MPANLENSAMATGLEKSVFIPIPKKDNAKEYSNYHTIALIIPLEGCFSLIKNEFLSIAIFKYYLDQINPL